MSCGFSSEPPVVLSFSAIGCSGGNFERGPPTSPATPNSGSTRLTDGRLPVAQSAKNCAMGERFCGYFSTVVPITPTEGRSV